MRIVFNTKYDKTAAAPSILKNGFLKWAKESGEHKVAIDDFDNYGEYEAVFFMSYDAEIEKARRQNSDILIGIFDPKLATRKQREEARKADFLMVSSIEQKDAFISLNKNIFVFYMFPEVEEHLKAHTKKPPEKLIIGYHGNKVHLESMAPRITKAFESLAQKYEIELWAIYNIRQLGKWRRGVPKISVKHIQWEADSYLDHLAQCDIGIVPSLSPINEWAGRWLLPQWWRTWVGYRLNYNKYDYTMRFKYSSGPGRVPIFSWLGIPVVADMYPSTGQVILDGESGLLAHSTEGWEAAIEKFINEPGLREKCAENSRRYFKEVLNKKRIYTDLIDYIDKLSKNREYEDIGNRGSFR